MKSSPFVLCRLHRLKSSVDVLYRLKPVGIHFLRKNNATALPKVNASTSGISLKNGACRWWNRAGLSCAKVCTNAIWYQVGTISGMRTYVHIYMYMGSSGQWCVKRLWSSISSYCGTQYFPVSLDIRSLCSLLHLWSRECYWNSSFTPRMWSGSELWRPTYAHMELWYHWSSTQFQFL